LRIVEPASCELCGCSEFSEFRWYNELINLDLAQYKCVRCGWSTSGDSDALPRSNATLIYHPNPLEVQSRLEPGTPWMLDL
jgi:hypothetical protein